MLEPSLVHSARLIQARQIILKRNKVLVEIIQMEMEMPRLVPAREVAVVVRLNVKNGFSIYWACVNFVDQ